MVRPARMPRSGLRRGSRQHVRVVPEHDLMRLGRVTAEITVKISVHRALEASRLQAADSARLPHSGRGRQQRREQAATNRPRHLSPDIVQAGSQPAIRFPPLKPDPALFLYKPYETIRHGLGFPGSSFPKP